MFWIRDRTGYVVIVNEYKKKTFIDKLHAIKVEQALDDFAIFARHDAQQSAGLCCFGGDSCDEPR